MDIFVDGHNLMFFAERMDARYSVERGEPARDALLGLLSRYVAVKGDKMVCFFDGGRTGGHLPRQTFGRGLQIVYSDPKSDADTEIKQKVATHDRPAEARVITSDNAIRRFVEKFGARVTGSREFLTEVKEVLNEAAQPSDEPMEKYGEAPDPDEEYWLKVFGDGGDDKK